MTTLNQRPKQHEMTWGAKGDLGGYNLYTADQLSQQEIERATAQYHMYKDMSAMAEQLDTLQAENNRLEATISNMLLGGNLDEERIVALEKTVIRLGGRIHS